jgi:hypothetical protein
MRAIAFALGVLVAGVGAGCGAQPNQPALANVPKPNTAAAAGVAAGAAAAITLASPDSHNPEKKHDTEKKPIKVKENVPAGVLDRADASKSDPAATSAKPDAKPTGAKTEPATPGNGPKPPARDALDFSQP